jgi:hypothetical protein
VTALFGSLEHGTANGAKDEARLHCPEGLCQLDERTLVVADRFNNLVRKVDLESGLMSTLAGCGSTDLSALDGVGSVSALEAHLFSPSSVCVDPTGAGRLFIGCDESQKCIRAFSPADGTLSIVAGLDSSTRCSLLADARFPSSSLPTLIPNLQFFL